MANFSNKSVVSSIVHDALGNPVGITFQDGVYKLNIIGKITSAPPPLPASATPVLLIADNPLTISGTIDSTSFVIPTGETFHLTQFVAGAAGDPTERGSAAELIFSPDGGTTEKIIQRIYVSGFTTTANFEPQNTSRDGTVMLGDGTATVFLRRRRLSGSSQEVDAVVQGYVLTL